MVNGILQDDPLTAYSSQQLEAGKVYSRADLKRIFDIKDATIRNGIFKPTNFNSVWLFVNKLKEKGQTQYKNLLDGDVLKMDGQPEGRTDHFIENHIERGLELLVFYRNHKREHSDYGFTYEGTFRYLSHKGSAPTHFLLHRNTKNTEISTAIISELKAQEEFNPSLLIDARRRTIKNLILRQGQAAFRKKILTAYSAQCAVTGCAIEALLEAAHIIPYLGTQTNVVSNGLLLRTDIHTLFDLGLLWFDPETLKVGLASVLRQSEYNHLENSSIRLPSLQSDYPSTEALRSHWSTRRVL
ncbi:hypothetical protein PS3A_55370 [Pseudomonas sp. 3A(2025)]